MYIYNNSYEPESKRARQIIFLIVIYYYTHCARECAFILQNPYKYKSILRSRVHFWQYNNGEEKKKARERKSPNYINNILGAVPRALYREYT